MPRDKDATRFWWIRHAVVTGFPDTMYGSFDVDCDCSNTHLFNAVAAKLPSDAVWYHSPLKRTKQTANGLFEAGAKAASLTEDPRIIEMHFGDYNGRSLTEMNAEREDSFVGFFPSSPFEKTPNGESFSEVCERVASFSDEMLEQHPGKDVVCVAHRGTILAALHNALRLPLETSVSFKIDNVSLSRLWRYNNIPSNGPQYKLGEVGWVP